MITLILNWPPSMNTLYPSAHNGRRFLSKKGKQYQQVVAILVSQKRALPGPIAYRMFMSPPNRRKIDLSNHVKAIEDCLTKCGFWKDDSLVDELHVIRRAPIPRGQVVMQVWSLDTECTPSLDAMT